MKTNKEREKETRSVNEKFVNLLNRTFEKYRDISVIERKEEQNCEPEEEEVGRTDTTFVRISSLKYDHLKDGDSSQLKPCEEMNRRRNYKATKLYKSKQFTPDEDKVIVETMKSAKTKSAGIVELSKLLNRSWKSIHGRIEILARTVSGRRERSFSLQEDFFIIDHALKILKQCKSLEETQLNDYNKLSKSLDRHPASVLSRWNTLQNWLLQFYRKTLNLEIRPMLINVLAEHFESILSIDWDWVKKIPEFSGYTANGLKRLFTIQILHVLSEKFQMERTETTLKQFADAAKDYKFSKVRKDVIMRQDKIIAYFEKSIKVEIIEFREMGK